MLSLYFTLSAPGYSPSACAPLSSSRTGNVKGSLPEGFTAPNTTSASALPASEPENHASSTAGTRSIHGIATALPETITTARLGLASASAPITLSCAYGRPYCRRSSPSQSWWLLLFSPPTKITASALRAAAAASAISCASERLSLKSCPVFTPL